jgi:glucokinase
MQTIIGVDVGGTLLRAARFDQDLNLLDRAQQDTLAKKGPDVVLDRLTETIRQVLPENPGDLYGIGLAMPGPLDPEHGILIAAPNLPFHNTPIGKLVQQACGGPVFLGNDADLAGLAEYNRGAGRGTRSMIYITISTGIGGGLILDGKLHTGRGQGGEIGHMVLDPNGPTCGCGHRGHLEALASGTAIARIARERLNAGVESSLREKVGGDLTQVSARLVGDAALEGDPMAVEIITQAGRYVGIEIASLMMLLNPDMFVLGGGVTRLGNLLFEPMNEAIREYAMHERFWQGIPIKPAELGDDVGLIGAAALVKLRRELQPLR